MNKTTINHYAEINDLSIVWCLMPLSELLAYCGGQFLLVEEAGVPDDVKEKNIYFQNDIFF